jgi:hypothetical protein
VHEAADAGLFGRGEHVGGARDVARLEARLIAGVQDARDVDDRFRPFGKPLEAFGPIERAVDPSDARARLLRATGQGADLMAFGNGKIEQMSADKTGGAGNGELQSGDHSIGSAGPSSST